MRRIYTCLLELADAAGRDPITARALTKQWVGRAYGGWPEHAEPPWQPAPGVTVRWRLLHDSDRDDEAFELLWSRPHPDDPTLWRRTTVQITVEAGVAGRVLVREQLESAEPKVREAPIERVRRPAVVPELVRAVTFVDGGWRVSAMPVVLRAERALEFDAFVRGDRRLPVVLVAASESGRVGADVDRFTDDLVGLAHVVVLDSATAVAAVAAELGAARVASPGGVRLLWPSWRSVDPPSRHPLWRAEEVAGPGGPRARVGEALAELVLDAATLRVEDDPLTARLERAQGTAELVTRRADLEQLRRAVADDRAAAEELIAEYQAELTHADDAAFRLEQELEREHELRVRAEDAYLRLATQGPQPSAVVEVRSLAEAVRMARGSLRNLVVLPEAERSAREWQYDRADLAYADLVRLDSVAADWAAGSLRVDFGTACRERGLDWAADVGVDARQKRAEDYLRTYQGRTIALGPHSRRGGRQLLRIYCYLDRDAHRVVVGHVGGHLGDRTT